MTATTELIAELESIANSSVFREYMVDEDRDAIMRAVSVLAAVQQPNRDAVFEAIADRLGEHEKAYNTFDPSDEAVTCITLKGESVEVLAEFIAPAVLAALAVPATGETESVYELFPGTQDALDALTIRPEMTQ